MGVPFWDSVGSGSGFCGSGSWDPLGSFTPHRVLWPQNRGIHLDQHESQHEIRTGPQRNHGLDSDLPLLMESQHRKLEESLIETIISVVYLHIKCRNI